MLSDKDWQAQDDARTLARAEEIKADPTKMSAAKVAAKTMVSEEEKRLQGLRKVSGKKVVVTTEPRQGTVQNLSIPSVQPVVDGTGLKFGLGKQPGTY